MKKFIKKLSILSILTATPLILNGFNEPTFAMDDSRPYLLPDRKAMQLKKDMLNADENIQEMKKQITQIDTQLEKLRQLRTKLKKTVDANADYTESQEETEYNKAFKNLQKLNKEISTLKQQKQSLKQKLRDYIDQKLQTINNDIQKLEIYNTQIPTTANTIQQEPASYTSQTQTTTNTIQQESTTYTSQTQTTANTIQQESTPYAPQTPATTPKSKDYAQYTEEELYNELANSVEQLKNTIAKITIFEPEDYSQYSEEKLRAESAKIEEQLELTIDIRNIYKKIFKWSWKNKISPKANSNPPQKDKDIHQNVTEIVDLMNKNSNNMWYNGLIAIYNCLRKINKNPEYPKINRDRETIRSGIKEIIIPKYNNSKTTNTIQQKPASYTSQTPTTANTIQQESTTYTPQTPATTPKSEDYSQYTEEELRAEFANIEKQIEKNKLEGCVFYSFLNDNSVKDKYEKLIEDKQDQNKQLREKLAKINNLLIDIKSGNHNNKSNNKIENKTPKNDFSKEDNTLQESFNKKINNISNEIQTLKNEQTAYRIQIEDYYNTGNDNLAIPLFQKIDSTDQKIKQLEIVRDSQINSFANLTKEKSELLTKLKANENKEQQIENRKEEFHKNTKQYLNTSYVNLIDFYKKRLTQLENDRQKLDSQNLESSVNKQMQIIDEINRVKEIKNSPHGLELAKTAKNLEQYINSLKKDNNCATANQLIKNFEEEITTNKKENQEIQNKISSINKELENISK